MESTLPIDNVTTFIHQVFGANVKDISRFFNENDSLIELAAQIISTEHAIYLMRRCDGLDGSNIDKMSNLRAELVSEYEQNHGSWPKDNYKVMW